MATTQSLVRIIRYNDEDLVDLNPDASIEDVLQMHAIQHPELATANVEGPTYEDGKQIFIASTKLGTKG
jgi:PRTRC genetic system protein C